MSKPKAFSVDDLWKIERLGAPSLSPDGAQVVAASTRYSMEDNKGQSSLWLLSTLGGAARVLTRCGDKDGQPRWSPRGDRIAFVAKREQEGRKDEVPQIYLIAPDGGEAHRAGSVDTGVEAFRWFPDGRRIALASWVDPTLRGSKAQAKSAKARRERKETGVATSQAQYRYWDHMLPEGRVVHLHVLDADKGTLRDLFEGTSYELPRSDAGAECFDVSPDGKRIVFEYDPQAEKRLDNGHALAEIELASGRITPIVQAEGWNISAPRYGPDGQEIAFLAQNEGLKHTMPDQLGRWRHQGKGWELVSAEWDHEVQAPLQWEADGSALLFTAEQEGRQHLWRFDLPDRRAEIVAHGGWVQDFDKAAGTLVTLTHAVDHPPRLHVHPPGQAGRRIESFNDKLLAAFTPGPSETLWVRGGQGDRVQVWLTYPPGYDPKKKSKGKLPLLHLVHGGPHTAFGDAWHFRWNAQVFAAQGYVVAAVNYHGSSGFGYAFKDSITHRWGELEQQDVEAATTALLKKPWADKRRVFLTGGSYGGFMAAWMNGHARPGRYAAYVCHAGCFDWTAMFADDAYTWHAKELGAWYWDDMAKVHGQSPHAFAAAMTTPTLVIHGALDYRVPDAQGLAYYNTLKARGVDARLLWFPDENHWILKPRNSRLWYGEFFDWLKRHDAGLTQGERTGGSERASRTP